jgi:hypothetical protein
VISSRRVRLSGCESQTYCEDSDSRFGVSVRLELVPVSLQILPDGSGVGNNRVVDGNEFVASTSADGMTIDCQGWSLGGPTRVGNGDPDLSAFDIAGGLLTPADVGNIDNAGFLRGVGVDTGVSLACMQSNASLLLPRPGLRYSVDVDLESDIDTGCSRSQSQRSP